MSEKLVLIDGHSILNRAYHGLPDLTNSEGLHTNAVYGFLNIMFKILDEEKPDYLTVAFDVHAPTFRHRMFDAYKGTRKPMDEELRQQVPMIKEMLTAMGIKIVEKEGYEAVQLGFEDISERKLTKPEKGHLDKAGVAPKKYLREFDLENAAELNVGDIVKADAFQAGDFVDVTGISKGHGYQGVIKRHGAHRLKETHGSGPVARQIGSLGATSHMSKIIKGTIGAGHMGVEQVTVQNLSVVKVDPELNMLVVCGAIPGPKGGLVTIKSTVKVHKVKQAGADISKNPQKASGRNPQKASARNK